MGTIAVRDSLRVIELTEQVTAACLLATCQAVEIRHRRDELARDTLTPDQRRMLADVFSRCPFIVEDRALDQDLAALRADICAMRWSLHEKEMT